MKRLLLASILICSLPVLADDAGSPASVAARQQESAERFSRIEADFEALKADNLSLRDEVSKLRQELARLRDEQGKTATAVANNNPQEDLKKLADKIVEVDRKREADKQAISEEIKRSISKLDASVAAIAAAAAERPAPHHERTPTPPPADVSDKGVVYVVESGDNLSKILSAFNAKFKTQGMKTVSLTQVKTANPSLNLDKPLKTGMKIVIPLPAETPKDKE